MKRKKVIKIGLDFDGVVAYNPFRLVRAPVKWFKFVFLKQKKVSFVVPKNGFEKLVWMVIHESSVLPARGVSELRNMANNDSFEFHLVTARFGFLEPSLKRWIKRNKLEKVFKTVNINTAEQQPHVYKLEKLRLMELDYFVEDNLDIVTHLHGKTKTKVLWVYNLIDRNRNYKLKFPYLLSALKKIQSEYFGIN